MRALHGRGGSGRRRQAAPDQFVRAELKAARAREAVTAVWLVIRPPAAHGKADQLDANHQPDPRAKEPAAYVKLVPDCGRLGLDLLRRLTSALERQVIRGKRAVLDQKSVV